MNTNIIRMIGCAIIVAALVIGYQMYSASLEEDFNNISRAEAYRIGDHYTGFYHRPGCPKVQQAYNGGIRLDDSKAALADGYKPCDRCDPDGPNDEN